MRCGERHLFHELHELCALARPLVVSDEVFEVVGVHDDVQTADVRQSDLVSPQARETDLLPRVHAVGLSGSVHCLSELLQVHVAKSEFGVVVDVDKQNLRGFEHAFIVAPLACQSEEREDSHLTLSILA